jgi:secondary thiamine-phosphate synthase enzyme
MSLRRAYSVFMRSGTCASFSRGIGHDGGLAVIAHHATLSISTQGNLDMQDLTDQVAVVVREAGVITGQVTVFVPGSTAALTTIEFETGALADLKAAIERLAPADIDYAHDRRWGDGNGHSHVRAALLGPDLHLAVAGGSMALGTWQQILLVDCDNRPRRREVIVSVVGQ